MWSPNRGDDLESAAGLKLLLSHQKLSQHFLSPNNLLLSPSVFWDPVSGLILTAAAWSPPALVCFHGP